MVPAEVAMTNVRTLTALLALSLGAFGAFPGAARADMMSACAPEISGLCSGVSQGRGRLAACLISHVDKLGAQCRVEVQSVSRSSRNNILLPAGVRSFLGSGAAPSPPAACQADAGRLCGDVAAGNGPILACLYAHTDGLSGDCAAEVNAVLR
jgi:hypothetical protein